MSRWQPEAAAEHGQHLSVAVTFGEAALGVMRVLEIPGEEPREIELPAGVYDGQILRVPADPLRAMPGVLAADDRYVLVQVDPDPRFRRDGRDLHCDLPISLAEALYGAAVEVDTLRGRVLARVPPGVESGQHLRLRGHGVAGVDGVPAGHLYVNLRVKLPDVDPNDAEAWAALRVLEARYRSPVREP